MVVCEAGGVTRWDDAADWYLDMVRDPTQGFNHLAADIALELAGPVRDRDVLDVGAGEGHLARRLAHGGARVVAVEPTDTLRAAAIDTETATPLGIRYHGDRGSRVSRVGGRPLASRAPRTGLALRQGSRLLLACAG